MKHLLLVIGLLLAGLTTAQEASGQEVEVTSGGQAYTSYLAAPDTDGPHPGVVLIHSVGRPLNVNPQMIRWRNLYTTVSIFCVNETT